MKGGERMEPTMGRHVRYKSFGSPGGEHKSVERVAIITEVVDEETVHLCVLNPTGMFFNLNVSRGHNPGEWEFPKF